MVSSNSSRMSCLVCTPAESGQCDTHIMKLRAGTLFLHSAFSRSCGCLASQQSREAKTARMLPAAPALALLDAAGGSS